MYTPYMNFPKWMGDGFTWNDYARLRLECFRAGSAWQIGREACTSVRLYMAGKIEIWGLEEYSETISEIPNGVRDPYRSIRRQGGSERLSHRFRRYLTRLLRQFLAHRIQNTIDEMN